MDASSIPSRPRASFAVDDTVRFTTEQAAYTYIESRMMAHMRALGHVGVMPAGFDAAITRLFKDSYADDEDGILVSLAGLETLIHKSAIGLLS